MNPDDDPRGHIRRAVGQTRSSENVLARLWQMRQSVLALTGLKRLPNDDSHVRLIVDAKGKRPGPLARTEPRNPNS